MRRQSYKIHLIGRVRQNLGSGNAGNTLLPEIVWLKKPQEGLQIEEEVKMEEGEDVHQDEGFGTRDGKRRERDRHLQCL